MSRVGIIDVQTCFFSAHKAQFALFVRERHSDHIVCSSKLCRDGTQLLRFFLFKFPYHALMSWSFNERVNQCVTVCSTRSIDA